MSHTYPVEQQACPEPMQTCVQCHCMLPSPLPAVDGKILPYLDGSTWGATDCHIQGRDYALPAHRAVLRTRCEHFRAR